MRGNRSITEFTFCQVQGDGGRRLKMTQYRSNIRTMQRSRQPHHIDIPHNFPLQLKQFALGAGTCQERYATQTLAYKVCIGRNSQV